MKKNILITLLVLLVLSIGAIAQQQNPDNTAMSDDKSDESAGTPALYAGNQQGQGNGTQNQTNIEQQTKTQEQLKNEAEQEQIRTQQRTEVQNQIQTQKQQLAQEINAMPQREQKVYRNQNTVREAVHALLAMENLTGGIGKNISAIAKEFNNSIQSTIRAEQRIETRNALTKFFAGGDHDAAQILENEMIQNQERIQELKRLKDSCDCNEETKNMMQEQITKMEQEQTRLKALADKEKKSKGLLGWMWK